MIIAVTCNRLSLLRNGLACVSAIFVLTSPVLGQQSQEAPSDASASAPELKLSADTWDFGTRWQGEPAEGDVTLTNIGNAVLSINKVRGSCGCTKPKVSKNELAPGESCTLHIVYDTKRRDRQVRKSVTVETNDPKSPKSIVQVHGEVHPLLDMDPQNGVSFGSLRAKEPATRTIDIKSEYSEPLKLRMTPPAIKAVRVNLEEIDAGHHWRLVATTVPPLENGPINAKVTLQTGFDVVPSVDLRIRGVVQPPVAVMPAKLYFVPNVDRSVERTLRIIVRDSTPVEILGVETNCPDIKAEILQAATTAATSSPLPLIRVTFPPNAQSLPKDATLTVRTTHPDQPELKVPIQPLARRVPRAAATKQK